MLEQFRPTNSKAFAFKIEETQFMPLRDLICFNQEQQGLEDYWLSSRLGSFSENSVVRMVIGFQASGS